MQLFRQPEDMRFDAANTIYPAKESFYVTQSMLSSIMKADLDMREWSGEWAIKHFSIAQLIEYLNDVQCISTCDKHDSDQQIIIEHTDWKPCTAKYKNTVGMSQRDRDIMPMCGDSNGPEINAHWQSVFQSDMIDDIIYVYPSVPLSSYVKKTFPSRFAASGLFMGQVIIEAANRQKRPDLVTKGFNCTYFNSTDILTYLEGLTRLGMRSYHFAETKRPNPRRDW